MPGGAPASELRERRTSDPPPISGTIGVRSSGSYPSRVRELGLEDGGTPPSLPTGLPTDAAPAEPAADVTPVPITRASALPALPLESSANPPLALRRAEPEVPSELPDPAVVKPAAPKPLLASEALMEDLAPVEPARQGARAWCAGVGVASLLFGALPLVGLLPGGSQAAIPWFVTGAIGLVAAVTPVTYRQRAVAMVVLGLLSGVVALQGAGGALMRADGGAGWGLARLLAAVTLPAALLFRARYRAYRGARVFLGAALATSLPFAVHTVLGLFGPGAVAQAGGVVVLFILAGSCAGFMGSETTGAGTYLAPASVIAIAAELALRGIGHGPLLGVGTGALAFGGASALAALGGFQIVAWRFTADARRIDLHVPRRESRPSHNDDEPASDWSTRD